jgi:enoyl-CoA hydratase
MLVGVTAIAEEIAGHSPLTIWGAKEALVYARDHAVPDALRQIATWQTGALQATDVMEAFTSKAEKRPAAYLDLPPAPGDL